MRQLSDHCFYLLQRCTLYKLYTYKYCNIWDSQRMNRHKELRFFLIENHFWTSGLFQEDDGKGKNGKNNTVLHITKCVFVTSCDSQMRLTLNQHTVQPFDICKADKIQQSCFASVLYCYICPVLLVIRCQKTVFVRIFPQLQPAVKAPSSMNTPLTDHCGDT